MVFSRDANAIWKALNGVVCIYKPLEYRSSKLRHTIINNICRDLNQMDPQPPTSRILIEPSKSSDVVTSETKLTVRVMPSYADHLAVTGPRFIMKDVKCRWNKQFGNNTTGVFLLGINRGVYNIHHMEQEGTMRTLHIAARLGKATDTGWTNIGKSLGRANFQHVPREAVDKILAATQATHQRQAFEFAKIDPQSQRAYDLAKEEGFVKPDVKCGTLIYQARCIKFEPPNFTIEVQCMNETEEFLIKLVSELGRRVRSLAACESIRCIRDGPFHIEHSLARSEWTLDKIMANMQMCEQIMRQDLQYRKKMQAV